MTISMLDTIDDIDAMPDDGPDPQPRLTTLHPYHAPEFNKQLIIARLHELERVIPGLHRDGKFLEAPCPKCGGDDRFYAGDKTGYTLFTCRSCGHKQRYGDAWMVEPRPAVKPYVAPGNQPGRVESIRAIYQSLTQFAQSHIVQGIDYLRSRGLAPAQARAAFIADDADLALCERAGLGYIDTQLYQQWYSGLNADEHNACEWAGLPDGSKGRLGRYATMFAGGHKGKIVFPYYNTAGKIVDIRTRSIGDNDTAGGKRVRYTSPKGSAGERGVTVPYGVHLIGNTSRIVLTEGEFKAIAANLLASVPTLGLRGVHDWMPEYFDLLRGKLVVLAFDNDDNCAGARATVQIGRMLLAHDIDVVVLDPALLGETKGIDDYILVNGGAEFQTLVQSSNLVTLPEYEQRLSFAGMDLAKIGTPRADVGTVRQWMPGTEVETFAHTETQTVTVNEATALIAVAVNEHLENYNQGNAQLLITAPAGVGKTQTTIQETLKHAEAQGQTVAVILPNHATIDEKIADGTLSDFRHVYGHNDDNCQQNTLVQAITRKGYSPGAIVCPDCPFAQWCKDQGYKSQFIQRENRAYVHAHAFTNYPENEDVVVADELGHKTFVDDMKISESDLSAVLANGGIPSAQIALLNGLRQMWATPGLRDLDGGLFYETLERFFPGLRDVDAWGDGSFVQGALFDAATAFVNGVTGAGAEDLPQQFGAKLIALLSDDVRRLNAGQAVTGRVRFVSVDARRRWLELTYSKGRLPGWYNTRPTIILNATANADIMHDLIGPLHVVAPQVAIADGNEIVQDITYNNAKSAYLGDSDDTEKRRTAWLVGIRSHIDAHPRGEVDTTIIIAKSLTDHVRMAFPKAKIAHYGALEGRNDLQSGLTILASSVPINLDAIVREAQALYPGIDTTKIRRAVAFDSTNAAGEYITVEQIDAVDPRLSALIAQHRDAMATQAVHRSRIVRQTGRKIVVMFARPIPGLPPTRIITDRPSMADKRALKTQQTIDKLVIIAGELIAEDGGFAADLLAAGGGVSINTAKKYLPQVRSALRANSLVVPVLQPLENGGWRKRTVELVISSPIVQKIKMHVDQHRYNIDLITNVIYVHLSHFIPNTWQIDIDDLVKSIAPTAVTELEGATVGLPGRWAGVTDAKLLDIELQRATTGSPGKQWAAATLREYLDATRHDRNRVRAAVYELGIDYLLNWGKLGCL